MKTEDFDDAIRRKLEGINPQYSDADIEKVHSYVGSNLSAPKKFNYLRVGVASVAAISIAGLLLWNVSQMHEQTAMRKTIDSLKTQVALTKTDAETSHKNNISTNPSTKNNTIANEEITTNSTEKLTANNKNDNSTPQEIKPLKEEVAIADKNQKKSTFTPDNKVDNKLADNRNSNRGKEEKSLLKNNKIEDVNTKKLADNNPIKNDNKNKEATKDNKLEKERNKGSLVNSENKKNLQNKAPDKFNDLVQTPNKEAKQNGVNAPVDSTLKENKSLVENQEENPKKQAPKIKTKKERKSFTLFDGISYRVGLGADAGPAQMGFLGVGELKLANNFGVSVGLKSTDFHNESFKDEKDFHERRGKDFATEYGNNLPPKDSTPFSDIRTFNRMLQLPVKLNYTLPLKHNFSLLVSAGTDIDLGGMEHVDCHRRKGPAHEDEPKKFGVNIKPVAINNAVFSVGVQKQWNHFIVQASPYISPQLNKVFYKKEDLYFGLSLKALYAFGG
ncbi:MAG: hypothetical protein NTX03_11135 [Bacteroidetes bacterium]|nr:hypothetical protein [Bacteroidota bacterium]